MRRFMMTFGGTLVVLGSALMASGQDKKPAQAPEKQAPAAVQAPEKQAPAATQAPAKAAPAQAPEKQAPAQAPTQKLTPVQKPTQAPTQKYASCGQCQSPVQKGEQPMKTAYRGGLLARYR
jgi:hypothetical protein